MPLFHCKAEESHSLGIVLRNTATTIIVALSNNILPKAAARRLALPSKRKPSRFVFGNTIACNVAEAECTLAVRAAQRRASRRQLKRSIQAPGNAWSAVNQHMRKIRVRGRMMLQRRPPPALGRVAEALLPIQPLPLLGQSFGLCRSVSWSSWRGRGLTTSCSAPGSSPSAETRISRMQKADLSVLRLSLE
jgi:hypothetical protein